MRAVKAALCAVAIVAAFAPRARADEWNKRTFLTFSGPVQIPGRTLPAGTYTFELADPDNARHVIRVSSKDGTQVYGMFMTIPDDRLQAPDDNIIMFAERPAGQPQAIQAWFYPGDRMGEEFVYPKSQAMQIAKAAHKSVLATETAMNSKANESERDSTMKGAKVGRVDENGRMNDDTRAPQSTTAQSTTAGTTAGTTAAPSNTATGSRPSRAPQSTTAQSTTADRSVGTSGAQGTTANRSRRSLPQTASNLALYELLSAAALAGAFVIRRVRA